MNQLKRNPCFNYIGDVLLELNGKLDLPVDTSVIGVPCETKSYWGPECENTRLAQTIESIKTWNKIYDNGLKHDLVLTDNSENEFFSSIHTQLSKSMEYTNSFIFHNNRNHYQHIVNCGGEKSALLLPIKFSTGGWAYGMGYKALIHWEAKYTPDLDYDWVDCIKKFIDEELDILVTPSRYGRWGFNHNCMIVRPEVWLGLSNCWKYTPELQNADMLDIWEAFNKKGLIWSDDLKQPYKYVNKDKMKLWLDVPCKWYRETKTVDYEETKEGYIVKIV